MTLHKNKFLPALGLFFGISIHAVLGQTARVQVVHNSPNAPAVDVFLGATKLLPNFTFRSASPFVDAPAGVPIQIRLKPASSSSDTSSPVFFRTYTLESGKGYYLIANGNLPGGTNSANPDNIPTGFDITVIPDAKETAAVAGNAELRIFHGVTDAPTVDIKAAGVGTLVDNAPFRGFSPYIPVPAATYTVQIAPASGSPDLLAYTAPLGGLAGKTALVLASGYFDPSQNQNGPAFGLWAFTTTGESIQLPTATSRVQVVHNSPNAPAVDVFLGATKLLPNFTFRSASPFVDAPAGVPIQVRLKPASASSDTSNPVFFRTYTLENGKGYYLIANGNLPGGTNSANPDNIPTGFDITVIPDAKETAAEAGNAELRIFHGVTDAPTVDIKAQGVATLVDNAPFRGFSPYIPVPAATYTVQISPASGSPNLLAYAAPLGGLAGKTALVLASGYFDPSQNQNGPAFGIWAFTTTGDAIQLPSATSRVQIVHNCANAPAVDIFVNGAKAVPGLNFRKATPFVSLPAGVPLTVAIKAASASSDTSNPAFRQTYELSGTESYSLVATGLLNTQGFAANPNGIATGFDITVMPGAREVSSTAATSNNADVRVLHAVTDAPFVDVRVQAGPTLVNNAGFRNFTPYISAPNSDLVLEVTDSAQTAVVAAFTAPLSAFSDSALVVMASGFLTPSANQDGPAFGLLAVTASGNAELLPVVTSVGSISRMNNLLVFPNPGRNNISFMMPSGKTAKDIKVFSMMGKLQDVSATANGSRVTMKGNLPAGMYRLEVKASDDSVYASTFLVE
jgi:hypothetical protein